MDKLRERMDAAQKPLELNTSHPIWRGQHKLPVWRAVIWAAVIGLVIALLHH